MSVHYDSVFYNENSNGSEYAYASWIKERMSPTVLTYITRLKQHVPNIDIYFFGSVTNFTFFENNSDVDCCVIYPDENTKNKVVQYVTEESLQFNIKRITFQQVKLSHPKYPDEFGDVYCIFFNDGSKIDFNLVPDKIGPILEIQHNMNLVFLIALYILKWLYYHAKIISKETFIYIKSLFFKVYHYMYHISVFRSEKQIIKS
jgi:predicted nucleotidyltransferase